MSRLTTTMDLAQQISGTAKEEAVRLGHPAIDLEHLFLAVVLSAGPAGKALRERGIDLTAARAAVARLHERQLADLGVHLPTPEPEPTRPAMIGRIDWAPRALAVLRRRGVAHTDVTLLRNLLDDPSGIVGDLLVGLDVDPTRLAAALADPPGADPSTSASTDRAQPATDGADRDLVAAVGFVPAPVGEVWELISDPARRTEWDDLYASVQPEADGSWVLVSQYHSPNGRAKTGRRPTRTVLRQTMTDPAAHHLVWDLSYPDAAGGGFRQEINVRLEPTPGGTDVALTARLLGRRGLLRAVLGRVLGPVRRFIARTSLSSALGGLSRHFR